MTPAPTVTLLDEELALLAPGAGPLPFLDTLEDDAHDTALGTAGRGLVVRGLAVPEGDALRPAPELADLLAPLAADGPQLHLDCPLPGAEPTRTVVRPLPAGLVHLHDTGEDGVHVLTLLDADDARARLAEVLDPGGLVGGAPEPADVLALLERPEAAARLRRLPGELALTVVTAGGRCLVVDSAAAGRDGGLRAGHVRTLDEPGLGALLDRLLDPAG